MDLGGLAEPFEAAEDCRAGDLQLPAAIDDRLIERLPIVLVALGESAAAAVWLFLTVRIGRLRGGTAHQANDVHIGKRDDSVQHHGSIASIACFSFSSESTTVIITGWSCEKGSRPSLCVCPFAP